MCRTTEVSRPPLESRRDDMFMAGCTTSAWDMSSLRDSKELLLRACFFYTHPAPTELKAGFSLTFQKVFDLLTMTDILEIMKSGESDIVEFKERFERETIETVGADANMSWDKLPARDAVLEEIDWEKVRQYIKKANETGRRRIRDDETPIHVLEKLDLVIEKRPSWAAILLFQNTPQRLLSQAVIHCGRFKQETIVIDDRMIEGTLLEQVEEGMNFMRKNMNVRFVMTGQPAREQIWDYPLEALREALINAVCHRDYTIPANTEVRMYDDRLEIWNPGKLPLGMTIEDLYKPHSSVLRNTGIGGIFYDLGWIEQWGSGIEKMRQACQQAGLPEPLFEEERHGFRTIFRKEQYPQEELHTLHLNERQMTAYEYAKHHGSIHVGALKSLVSGVSEKTLYRDLQEMTRKGILKASGSKRWRRYTLV